MQIWIYTDAQARLIGVNLNNMTGNTGWSEAVGASALGKDPINAQLRDTRGVACYKVISGVVVERTQEEMDADYVAPESKKTDSERLAELEEQVAMHTDCILEMSEVVYA